MIQTSMNGLSVTEVAESRARYGSNVLTAPPRESLWRKLAAKFAEPLIVILMIAGAMSIGIACYNYFGHTSMHGQVQVFFEPLGIFIAIAIATLISFYFEVKAEREFSLLSQVGDDEPVIVVRDGNTTTIPRRDVVVGDVVMLATGDEIPADARLLESHSLRVDESTLTGEPVTDKSVTELDAASTFPSDHVMRGTKVLEGHGIACVYAVGDATECGKVYEAAQIDSSVVTPLDEQLSRLAHVITRISYGIALLLIVGRTCMFLLSPHFASPERWMLLVQNFLESFMLAVALIVCAVPEGLPMAVSLCLALSMRRMMKTNNLVRRMHACETMGATTVICTDKTGTLTQNRMQVVAFTEPVLPELIAACSTAELDFSTSTPTPVGNPTECALLLWLWQQGIDYRALRQGIEQVDEVPFTTERKYMSVTVKSPAHDGRVVRYTKGAPEIVYDQCAHSTLSREAFETRLLEFQQRGMRTLGFAIDDQFVSVVAIADPIRPDVPDAIAQCREAGIRVIIVTGDSQATATEIGRQVGIISPDDIIYRARPLDKKQLVERLQAEGQVVAVTGDGTNDAPALNAAHVGLSMGDGTSVAKESSDITILDNSFASIVRAVMWGRSLYRNIQRFVLFQMTVCVIACAVVLFGAFTGDESPLTVTQMLWVNLIMDTFAAMALASLPPSMAVMHEAPRRRTDFIVSRPMWYSIIGGGSVLALLLIALLVVPHLSVPSSVIVQHLGRYTQPQYFFTLFVFIQFWNLFNAASYATGGSALHLLRAHGFISIASVIVLGQILIVTFGGEMFNVQPLPLIDWLILFVATSPVLWVGEVLRRGN